MIKRFLWRFVLLAVLIPAVAFAVEREDGKAVSKQKPDSAINAYEEFSRSINKSISKNFTAESIKIFVGTVVFLVLVVVGFEIYRSNKVREDLLKVAWKKFKDQARTLRLSGREVDLLTEIVQESALQEPNSVLKSPHVLETCLEKIYNGEKVFALPDDKLADIRNLRKSLNFLPLSREIAFSCTRQFDEGEKCMVQIPADTANATHKGMAIVIHIEEKFWTIAGIEGAPIAPGTSIRMNLTRAGDAEYSFRTTIREEKNGELVLLHTDKLNRAQQRNWVRVDVSLPVEVSKVEEGRISDVFDGKIIDMSGGGVGIALPMKLMTGTKLMLSFELPGQPPIYNLLVKVVRVAGAFRNDATKTIHSVAFDGDVHSVQEQIIQYVFEKQRQEALIKRG
ncbi:hypothetical protein AGMMS49938_14540 [Fibrobacterales bacterium]|nr:hypothetical protein AGMMS49938_14540 [Fibrobacterales bacterium]